MSITYQGGDPSFKVIREPSAKGERITLELDGVPLDPANYSQWLGGASRLHQMSAGNAELNASSFECWLLWSRQVSDVEQLEREYATVMWESVGRQNRHWVRSVPLSGLPSERADMERAIAPKHDLLIEKIAEMFPGTRMVIAEETPQVRVPIQLKIKRLHERAIMPTFGTVGAACFDLYAMTEYDGEAYACTMEHPSLVIETGLAFEVPEGWVMKVYSRSGQGFKENTRLGNCVGIIDSDYRGALRIKLTRDDDGTLFVKHGERVAQAMLVRVQAVEFVEVDELSETQRGTGAYGSTGR